MCIGLLHKEKITVSFPYAGQALLDLLDDKRRKKNISAAKLEAINHHITDIGDPSNICAHIVVRGPTIILNKNMLIAEADDAFSGKIEKNFDSKLGHTKAFAKATKAMNEANLKAVISISLVMLINIKNTKIIAEINPILLATLM